MRQSALHISSCFAPAPTPPRATRQISIQLFSTPPPHANPRSFPAKHEICLAAAAQTISRVSCPPTTADHGKPKIDALWSGSSRACLLPRHSRYSLRRASHQAASTHPRDVTHTVCSRRTPQIVERTQAAAAEAQQEQAAPFVCCSEAQAMSERDSKGAAEVCDL